MRSHRLDFEDLIVLFLNIIIQIVILRSVIYRIISHEVKNVCSGNFLVHVFFFQRTFLCAFKHFSVHIQRVLGACKSTHNYDDVDTKVIRRRYVAIINRSILIERNLFLPRTAHKR